MKTILIKIIILCLLIIVINEDNCHPELNYCGSTSFGIDRYGPQVHSNQNVLNKLFAYLDGGNGDTFFIRDCE
jgi:hypothetical protein